MKLQLSTEGQNMDLLLLFAFQLVLTERQKSDEIWDRV